MVATDFRAARDPSAPQVLELGVVLLWIAAGYQLFDGLNIGRRLCIARRGGRACAGAGIPGAVVGCIRAARAFPFVRAGAGMGRRAAAVRHGCRRRLDRTAGLRRAARDCAVRTLALRPLAAHQALVPIAWCFGGDATRVRVQAPDPGPSPSLERRHALEPRMALSTRHLSKRRAGKLGCSATGSSVECGMNSACRCPRTGVPPSVIVTAPGRLHAPYGFSGLAKSAQAPSRKRSIQYLSPARVCLPSSGKGTGSTACNPRVSAFPSSGKGTGSIACNPRVSAFPLARKNTGSQAIGPRLCDVSR